MMERQALVHVDLHGSVHLVGRLYAHLRRGRESASFEYDAAWLENPARFALEPALQLGPGPFHTGMDKALFGAIGDSAPDRWGRVLLRRAEQRRASTLGETPRTLFEIDFLLQVNDETRQGALRFSEQDDGIFLAPAGRSPVPPLLELPRLLAASERLATEEEQEEDLWLLVAPGSSLGGARPKASVRDRSGRMAIAKFPHRDDEWNAVLWEAVALELAKMAGIRIAAWRTEMIAGKDVLLVDRFDRDGASRIPFLSAMSMLGASDRETHSYLEIADALRRHGAQAVSEMHELWRRMVFTVLISNVDDHLRNHGFLYAGTEGWLLSPAYDLNPVPADVKARVLSTAITAEDQTASLELALSVAEYFELSPQQARVIASEVGRAVSAWRVVAAGLGIGNAECQRMASAFEHADLSLARKFNELAVHSNRHLAAANPENKG